MQTLKLSHVTFVGLCVGSSPNPFRDHIPQKRQHQKSLVWRLEVRFLMFIYYSFPFQPILRCHDILCSISDISEILFRGPPKWPHKPELKMLMVAIPLIGLAFAVGTYFASVYLLGGKTILETKFSFIKEHLSAGLGHPLVM